MVDALRNRIPGMSDNLDPQRDVLGRPVLASEVGGYSPVAVTTRKHDVVAAAIFDAFDATGEKLTKPPRVRNGVDWSQFDTPNGKEGRQQSAYDRMGQLVQESGVEEALHSLVTSDGYAALPDILKVEKVRSIIGAARNSAEKQVLADPRFAELRAATTAAKLQSRGVSDYQRLLAPPQ